MKGQGNLNSHIIFENVLMLFVKGYQKYSVLLRSLPNLVRF